MSQGLLKALEIKHCLAQGLSLQNLPEGGEKSTMVDVRWSLEKKCTGKGSVGVGAGDRLTFEQMPKREPPRLRKPGSTAGT